MPSVAHLRTFLAGLGLAGSVLGAVIAAFALASGVVVFSVWPDDPVSSVPAAFTVQSLDEAGARRAERELVLPAPTSASATATPRAVVRGATANSGAPDRDATPAAGAAGQETSADFEPDVPGADVAPERPTNPAEPTPSTQQDGALGRLGGIVDDTTAELARSLRAVTGSLGEGLKPVSPLLGDTVAGLGAGLGTAVQDVGRALAALLGHPSRQTAPAPR